MFTLILILLPILLNSCGGKLPGADARKYDPDPKKRVQKNLEEGRGFNLSKSLGGSKGGVFENMNLKYNGKFYFRKYFEHNGDIINENVCIKLL